MLYSIWIKEAYIDSNLKNAMVTIPKAYYKDNMVRDDQRVKL